MRKVKLPEDIRKMINSYDENFALEMKDNQKTIFELNIGDSFQRKLLGKEDVFELVSREEETLYLKDSNGFTQGFDLVNEWRALTLIVNIV